MKADIDLDFADRDSVLKLIPHTSARQMHQGQVRKHNSGVYVTDIPYDPVNQCAAIDYETAEQRGYFKLDFLNMSVYREVTDEQHLERLMREPDWSRLRDPGFVQRLTHLSNHYDLIVRLPEPIHDLETLAMCLALIRPAKRHLSGLSWSEIRNSIWTKPEEGYYFKRSHSFSYAMLVVVHMNLLTEQDAKTHT
jgi:hypothetical protein